MVVFYDVTRRLLEERLQTVKNGQTPPFTDIRHFFYECRNRFLRENPQFTENDSKSKNPYEDWQLVIMNWCKKHCGEFNVDEELWWRVREKLNIWAEGRAVCEGETGNFLIEKDTRPHVTKNCSFVLLCEKKTVTRQLLEKLRGKNYKLNVVSTGGYSPSDVQEAILTLAEEFDNEEEPTFYFLILHDYDRDGVKIYYKLKQRYPGVIDIGVNRELIEYLKEQGDFDARLVEEKVKNKNFQRELKSWIEASDDYTLEDFTYLQGEQVGEKRWVGKRIEIDAIHVEYGIEPFVKYAVKKIKEECKCWDLTRIGVEEYELTEPDNPFEGALRDLNYEISTKCHETWKRISEPLKKIEETVKSVTDGFRQAYRDLRDEQGIVMKEGYYYGSTGMGSYKLDREELSELKKKYKDGFEREYTSNFEDELEEINSKVHKYYGDITEAKEDLDQQFSDLQQDVDAAASEDEEAERFRKSLGELDWGEDEFDELPVPDEKEVIKAVIAKLQKIIEEKEYKP